MPRGDAAVAYLGFLDLSRCDRGIPSAEADVSEQGNSAFIPGTKLQFAWDSVSIGALKMCPRYYELSIIEGWEPRKRSVDLHFGILLHSARERFYHAKAGGSDHDSALRDALSWAFDATFDRELGKPWASEDPN